ncbi:hypothetical protein JVT61DRAFT_12221 [Boletus reticuloceps]|uniref:C2H2-type domain-containing protein n=1 Tax=Boletus reticuloceps TaxID=495285 RepID=A0A8I2YED2_9AGAM|nr:hypothetical protein JVT61DRAFT_12221 [Boletus reticuloceps]
MKLNCGGTAFSKLSWMLPLICAMPRAKSRCKQKNIRCPHCGKKFSGVTNVLQHLNQLSGSCFGKSLFELDSLVPNDDSDSPEMEPSIPLPDNPPSAPDVDVPPQHDEDIEMDNGDMLHPPRDPPANIEVEREQMQFVEVFEGCAEAFLGGKTFMSDFWNDQYASQQQDNLYFPWASKEEWAFALWLLRSRLSMVAIDTSANLHFF